MAPIKQPNLAALRAARAKAKAEAEAAKAAASATPLPTPESNNATPEVEVKEEGAKKKVDSKKNLDFFNQAPIAFKKILKHEKEAKMLGKRKSCDDSSDEDEGDGNSESDEEPVKRGKGKGKAKGKRPVGRPRKRSTTAPSDSDSDTPPRRRKRRTDNSDSDSDTPPPRRKRTTPTPPPSSPKLRTDLTPPPTFSSPATRPSTARTTRSRPSLSQLPSSLLPSFSQSTPTASNTITLSSDSPVASDSECEVIQPPKLPTPPPPPTQEGPNPLVEILITRHKLKDARVYVRKYRQTIKKVREQWCADFGHNPKEIVLTFKGRKIFDYSTCRALGVPLREEGPTQAEKERIKLVAWREKEWEERREWGYESSEDEVEGAGGVEGEGGDGGEESEVEGDMLSLLLKGRDRQEWKISVNKNSTVAKLIAKFKREHKIDADKEVQLQFDGEELEGDVKLVDTEVEDDDCLDVIFS